MSVCPSLEPNLIRTQNSQALIVEILRSFRFILITGVIFEIWILRRGNVIRSNFVVGKAFVVRRKFQAVQESFLCRKFGDNFGIASF